MPAQFLIDHERRVVFSRAWGKLTDEDLFNHQKRLLAHDGFNPAFGQLCDMREVRDESEVSTQAVHALAGVNVFAPWAHRAFVAPRPISQALARIFQLLREYKGEVGIRVYPDLPSGRHWVGLED